MDLKMKVIENENFESCFKMKAKYDRFISFMNSLSLNKTKICRLQFD